VVNRLVATDLPPVAVILPDSLARAGKALSRARQTLLDKVRGPGSGPRRRQPLLAAAACPGRKRSGPRCLAIDQPMSGLQACAQHGRPPPPRPPPPPQARMQLVLPESQAPQLFDALTAIGSEPLQPGANRREGGAGAGLAVPRLSLPESSHSASFKRRASGAPAAPHLRAAP
jgi:hypothetical protein